MEILNWEARKGGELLFKQLDLLSSVLLVVENRDGKSLGTLSYTVSNHGVKVGFSDGKIEEELTELMTDLLDGAAGDNRLLELITTGR